MDKHKKICIFPTDPIKAYYDKGELKERYFNPENFFDKIDVISFTETDIEEDKVQMLFGRADLNIHVVGKISIVNKYKILKKTYDLIETLKPSIIRAYNPLLQGWVAAHCAKKLNVPFYLSLHTQFDGYRTHLKQTNFKKFLIMKYTEHFIEPFVLKSASKITIVYKIIEPYITRHGGIKPELLYNRLDYERFDNAKPIEELHKPLIISVGNLTPEKNHECIIRAMKNIKEAHLLIIGQGSDHEKLTTIIKKENLENKIKIIQRVPHEQIQNYYKSADVFVLAYNPNLEGLPMPVMEAMAAGTPVVIPKTISEYSDGLEGIAVFSKRTPESFAENIRRLLENEKFFIEAKTKSKTKALEFDQKKIEKREREIYEEIIKSSGD